jgi:Putative glycosyl/glycerophosphate transferases involved in teichoic acid biosynthesis TagF/TagB/EpsJ/RodC
MKRWIKGQFKRIYHAFLWRKYFPQVYKKASQEPLREDKIIFIEQNTKALSSNLQLIYQQLKEKGIYRLQIHYLAEHSNRWRYLQNAKRCLQEVATARTVFLSDGSRLLSCIDLRLGTQVAQVWHGCGAFKKFGLSTTKLLFGGGQAEYLAYPYYRNCDIVTVSSTEVVWAYEEAMGFKANSGIVKPFGVSRTDVFFKEGFRQEAYEHIATKIPAVRNKQIILYAPTFRGNAVQAAAPDVLDLLKLQEHLQDDYVLLIKHHPFVKHRPLIDSRVNEFAFDVSDICTITNLIGASDICISDYSSLVFEYSLMARPMIFFAYDLADYQDWRGFYYDYKELTPGVVVKTTDEVIEQIKNVETFDLAKVRAFKEQFMSNCDGNATERLLAYLNL